MSLTPDSLYSIEAALHVNQILALAKDEHDILAAFTLSVPETVTMHLLYLNWSGTDTIHAVRWTPGYSEQELPLPTTDYALHACPAMQAFVGNSLSQRDPILFVEEAPATFPVLPASLTGTQSLTILRLSGRAYAAQTVSMPHTLLCIAWPNAHRFSIPEQAFYAAVLDVAAAVVSNYRLRLEAFEHVQQLRELDRLKSEFLATVNHELRTPLNAILALSSAILDGSAGEISGKLQADLEVIYRASEQLHILILDILNYTQLESGKPMGLDVRPFPLDELVTEAAQFMQRLSGGKPITIRSSVSASLPPVLADPQRTRQVLTNLLVNAIKFTDQGTIQITAQIDDGNLVVCVEDSGTGIPPEYQAVIFEPFRQLHSPGRPKGTGLGLSICKRLMALMDGNIWVESQIGKGSRFYFSLPTS